MQTTNVIHYDCFQVTPIHHSFECVRMREKGGYDVSLPIYLSLTHICTHYITESCYRKEKQGTCIQYFFKKSCHAHFLLGKWLKMHMAILFIKAN